MSEQRPVDESTTSHHALGEGRATRRLLVLWDSGMTQHELPPRGAVSLGRGPDCDVRIDHTSVSRKHAVLHVGAGYAIEDFGSANGTRVDGKAIGRGERVTIVPGQEVRLGATTLILPPLVPVAPRPPMSDALGPTMRALYETVALVAKGRIPVLVVGETGAGKEVIARELHRLSPRAAGAFSTISCAAIPETNIESELFGERGKSGLIEAAAGGTVFLDEVGDLPLAAQAKLLRVIESGEVLPLGSLQTLKVDVRFFAATNRSLEDLVAGERFRADLFYRLSGAKLVVPPLRERPTEIGPLAEHLAAGAAAELGEPPPAFTQQALGALARHSWPGNVRELRNVVERAFLLARGRSGARVIGIEHLPNLAAPIPQTARQAAATAFAETSPTLPPPATAPPVAQTGDLRHDLGAIERERIQTALAQCDGNQSRAAKLLGISRRTLVSRLDAHQLPRPRKKTDDSA